MNKVFGFGAMLISVLLFLNVLYVLYKMFFAAGAPDAAAVISVTSILWIVLQLAAAVILWFTSRVFIKMG